MAAAKAGRCARIFAATRRGSCPPPKPVPADALLLPGVVAQAFYVGQGYRYRVRAGGTEVWVHAPERMDEGTSARVAVPRDALMLFPRDSTTRT